MNTVKEKNRQVAVLFWCIYLFVSHPELNSKRQKRRPLRQISARLQAVPCVICLQWFVSKRLFSYPVVELGREVEFAIAEMACVSSNVRRTFHVPSGVRVQRSISGRDVSHPRVEPLIAFSHILELNSGSQDWRPLPDMSARLVSSPLRHISPVFQSWAFALVSLLERSLAFVFVS